MNRLIFLMVGMLFFSACSSIKITTDYDKSADFKAHKTFFFLPWSEQNSERVNDLNKQRFYNAIAAELTARGYEQKESNGDLAVNLLVVLDQKTGTTAYTDYYNTGGYGYRYGGWGWGMGYSTTTYQEYDYTDGTLIVDIFDTEKKSLIWQGVASGEVKEANKNREKRINDVMYKLFYYYPVKKLK